MKNKGVNINMFGTGRPTYAQQEAKTHFLMYHEYQDFIEFLDDELGVEWRKELQEKFYNKMDEL